LLRYSNPIITADYPDPDVIRVGKDFYMVSSSFNYFPGVPIMHSTDLVNWELINYVIAEPVAGFNKVRSGEGAWACSIRYHKGIFYCLIPFPDEGLFVSVSIDPYGKWSKLKCLYEGKGYEDPCPIWIDDKTYVVFAFVKSRIGFNSKLGLIETDETLSAVLSDNYSIIYDGTEKDQTIEGPKVYKIGKMIYILAPAGGVEHGYQVGLSSRSIMGPFRRSVLLKQGDNGINGPHQGALIDIDDKKRYAFIHFEDQKELGRVVMLEPADIDCNGNIKLGINSLPVRDGVVLTKEDARSIDYSDSFDSDKLSLIWQTPAIVEAGWINPSKNGLVMNSRFQSLDDFISFPYRLCQKVSSYHQKASLILDLFLDEGDKMLFGIIGRSYLLIGVKKSRGKLYRIIATVNQEEVIDEITGTNGIILDVKYDYPNLCSCSENKKSVMIDKEHWTGLHYCIGLITHNSSSRGFAVLKRFTISK